MGGEMTHGFGVKISDGKKTPGNASHRGDGNIRLCGKEQGWKAVGWRNLTQDRLMDFP